MTKLQLLHRALNERLMAAVEQIMEMVGGTVLEYEVETVRARKENEELRRRLRWMEGEILTNWPEIEIDTSGSGQPVIVVDEPVQNCPSIEIEPIDVSDLQSLIPDASLAAAVSIRSADLEIIPPATTEATNSGISNSMGWDSSLSYMAPLDFDPTVVKHREGRSRSKKMSYACLHCGKVFEREQRLISHMRTHSADRPYAYRSRKACFYGDRKRRNKLHGLSNGFLPRKFVEDHAAESTGPATVSDPVAAACSSLKAEPEKATKRSKIRAGKPVGGRRRRRPAIPKEKPQCLECKRFFAKPSNLAMHMRIHRRPLASQKEKDVNNEMNKTFLEHPEPSELGMEKSSDGLTVAAKEPCGGKTFKCSHCYKSYNAKNCLEMHMVTHNKPPFRLEEKLKDKIQKNGDMQTPPEGSSIKFSTIQNGNDGGKPSYTCPFCGKDFRHRSQLTVHMQSHICEKRYPYRQRKEQFYGDRKRPKVPDPSSQKPVIKRIARNGGFVVTRSQKAMSQDHTSPSESLESIEPQSVCSERKFNLLPWQAFSANSSCITSRPTSYLRLQPRIVLQPVCVKSRIGTLPEERDRLKSVKNDRSDHVPKSSSQSDSTPKQQVSDPEPVCEAFSDVDSNDDNEWSDVHHNLEKLADLETVDIAYPKSSEKDSDAASNEEFVAKRTEERGAHDDLTNRDDIVATSVQVTSKHTSCTCMICGLKFASKPSLSQHMRTHSSSGYSTRKFKAKVKQQVGQEQTPESQEVSTNVPEIKKEMDFATVIEEKISQSSGRHPDIDTSARSKEGSETLSKSRKPNKESMERKYLHCCFCSKACRTIELHLKFDHPREPEVMDALRRGKNAKERKRLLSGLCTLKRSESDKKDPAVNEDLVHCLFCQGSYRRNQFWKHALVCEQKKEEGASTVSDAAHSTCTTTPSPVNGPSKAQKGLKKQINDSTFNTAQDTLSEELTDAPVPEDHPSTVQTVADPHKADSPSDASSADVQKTDPATADSFILVPGSSKNTLSDLKSSCSPVQDGDSSETHGSSDPETSQVEKEMGKNDKDTGNPVSDLGLRPDSDCTTVLKRKLDNQDSEFTDAKTRKMIQSDPSQPEKMDNNLSDEAEAASQSTNSQLSILWTAPPSAAPISARVQTRRRL